MRSLRLLLPLLCAASLPAFVVPTGRIPLSFEPNRGQGEPGFPYLARSDHYKIDLAADRAVLHLNQGSAAEARVQLQFRGAQPIAEASAEEEQSGVSNYLRGSDRSRWLVGIPHYRRIRFRGVYPGIDVVYYGHEREMEYDFVLQPGADPRQIRLKFAGSEQVSLENTTGDLLLRTTGGVLRQHKPLVYQEKRGKRIAVGAKFRLDGDEVRLDVTDYDRTRPLV